jgi:glycosyltransferase involved in cell wall biosynthesis
MEARQLRVTMVNKYYWPPHIGGVEAVVRWLSEGLAEHAGAQVRALVCNEGPVRVDEVVGGVRVVRLPRHGRVSSAPVAAGLPGALRRELSRRGPGGFGPPDVVNFHTPYPWGELSFLQARSTVPSVVLYHSDVVRQRRLLAAYAPFLRRFLDSVDLIIASSPQLIASSPFLAPRAGKCRVVPFGLPPAKLGDGPGVRERAAKLRAAHAGRPIVLFVGRLVSYKGVEVLVRAMAGVDADLVLIGRGPLEAEVRRLAAACGVAGRTTILPPQDDAELAAWYRAADVFCLPSVLRSEAFGLVQLEAHAAGTPVVSTSLPTGVPFANLNGVTGLVVAPGDAEALGAASRRLLEDEELRARLGGQARERVRREFTVERMVARTLDVYAEAREAFAFRGGRRPQEAAVASGPGSVA